MNNSGRAPDSSSPDDLLRTSADWPSWDLDPSQLADVDLILSGAYHPLTGFMTRAEHDACLTECELPDGTPFPAPIVLKVSNTIANACRPGRNVLLRDPEAVPVAALRIDEVWRRSGLVEAEGAFLAGPIEGLVPSPRGGFPALRLTTAQVRRESTSRGWTNVIGYVSSGMVDRRRLARLESARRAYGAALLMIAEFDAFRSVGADHYLGLRLLDELIKSHPAGDALLWLVPPLGDRGPRASMLQVLMASNAGCTHFVVDEEPGHDLTAFAARLSIALVGPEIPRASLEPSVALHLDAIAERWERLHTPRIRQGFTVFFTGLSGSGKSTIANLLRIRLLEAGQRHVTLLDGDVVRKHLSSELGFSREHRDLNVRRIAFVAAEITKNGGAAICAPIAPYESIRAEVRRTIEALGGFVLVFVDTPLEACELRDRKGLYARARAGLIENFTGVSDPYEPPADADVVIRTLETTAEEGVNRVLECLRAQGYLPPADDVLAPE